MTIKRYLLIPIAIMCMVGSCAKKPAISFDIAQYGAKADGKTVNTAAINKAIKACADAGGGTVTVSSGTYVTGPIEMLGNINLYLEQGAILKASTNLQDYRVDGKKHGLIRASNAENVSITGTGTINGMGTSFMDMDTPRNTPYWTAEDIDPDYTRQGAYYMHAKFGTADGPVVYEDRPGRMVLFSGCKNVLLKDITIKNAPSWTVHLDGCQNIDIIGIDIINSLVVPNSDGIHLTTCRDVRISDCDIEAGDDCIAVTCIGDEKHKEILGDIGGYEGGSGNINVTNCTLQSRSAGVRIGYTGGDIKNCTFKNLIIRESNRGLLVNVRAEGSVENISFSDITIETRLHTGHWWGQGEAIHVSAIAGDLKPEKLGQIRNIRFSNITAESESGIVVYGGQDSIITDVLFDNVKLRIKDSPLNESYGGNIDLRSTADLSKGIFMHDIPALYATHTEGLTIKGFEVEWADELPPFFNHGIHCEYFKNLRIEGFKARQPQLSGVGAAIALNNGNGVAITNCKADDGTYTFLSHAEVTGERLFTSNDLAKAEVIIYPVDSGFTLESNIIRK